jgi:phosphorylcholine metabolism protein LicD
VYEYGYSEFLECNRELALKLKNSNYKQNYDTNSKMMPTLAYVADYLESTNKHYFLVAGTLLGWFRDCGIIPHTNDLDLAIPDLEYSNSIKKHFIQNRDVYLIIENGLIHVMYELRVYGKHYLLDLFVSYKQNATHAYTGYQTHRTLTKWFI